MRLGKITPGALRPRQQVLAGKQPKDLIPCQGGDCPALIAYATIHDKSLPHCERRLIFFERRYTLAISKARKQELVAQYKTWLTDSEAVVLTEYSGLDMLSIDKLREDMREAGGEFHILKNTLAKVAFSGAGYDAPDNFFIGSTAIGIAFEDPPGVAKALADLEKDTEFVKIKGGFMGSDLMTAEQIKVMAELPPLPVVRGQLLGTIMAPASQLTRLLAEPGRQLAQVIKAYSESDSAAAAA